MALYPQCRVVLEGTGEEVAILPPFTSWPPVDSVLYLTINGAAEVAYKVEKYTTHAHVIGQVIPEGAEPRPGVDCYSKMIVSVVP